MSTRTQNTMNKITARVLAAGAVVLLASGCYYETAGHAVPNPASVMTTPASTAVPAPLTNASATNAPTTKPALQPGPHSWIADVDLPEGTVQCTTWECSDTPLTDDDAHTEYWRYSAPYDDTVAFLRDRFANGPRYDAHGATWWKGLPPCYNTAHQSPPSGWIRDNNTDWKWSDGAMVLEVTVFKPGSRAGNAPFGVMVIYEGFVSEHETCYRA